jgi:hypothetical protein
MQIICSIIILLFINGCYLITAFNMESIIAASSDEEDGNIVSTLDPNRDKDRDIDLADLLDLDIFDFDIDELIDSREASDRLATDIRSVGDQTIS